MTYSGQFIATSVSSIGTKLRTRKLKYKMNYSTRWAISLKLVWVKDHKNTVTYSTVVFNEGQYSWVLNHDRKTGLTSNIILQNRLHVAGWWALSPRNVHEAWCAKSSSCTNTSRQIIRQDDSFESCMLLLSSRSDIGIDAVSSNWHCF